MKERKKSAKKDEAYVSVMQEASVRIMFVRIMFSALVCEILLLSLTYCGSHDTQQVLSCIYRKLILQVT